MKKPRVSRKSRLEALKKESDLAEREFRSELGYGSADLHGN